MISSNRRSSSPSVSTSPLPAPDLPSTMRTTSKRKAARFLTIELPKSRRKRWVVVFASLILVSGCCALVRNVGLFLAAFYDPPDDPRPWNAGRDASCPAVCLEERIDCLPDKELDQSGQDFWRAREACLSRDCCWAAPSRSQLASPVALVPSCFFPRNKTFYRVTSIIKSLSGITLTLTLKDPDATVFPGLLGVLEARLTRVRRGVARITIGDAARIYENDEVIAKTSDADVDFLLESIDSNFVIRRRSDSVVVFDTRLAPYLLSKKFLQLTTTLAGSTVFGLGPFGSESPIWGGDWARIHFRRSEVYHRAGAEPRGLYPVALTLGRSCVGRKCSPIASGLFFHNANVAEAFLQPYPALTFRANSGVLDFFLYTGRTPADVFAAHWSLVGRPTTPPFWALGLHLSCRGVPARKLLQRLRTFCENGFSFTNFWVDEPHADDTRRAITLSSIVSALHQNKFVIRPRKTSVGEALLGLSSGIDLWTKRLQRLHQLIPFDGVMIDDDVSSLQGRLQIKTVHAALQRLRPDRHPFVATKTSFPAVRLGGSRVDWRDLASSVAHLLTSNFFGVPLVGVNFCGNTSDSNAELCVRQTQLGAVFPLMINSVGSSVENRDLSSFKSPQVGSALKEAFRLHYRIAPFLYSRLLQASVDGSVPVRPMFFDFFTDPQTWNLSRQFMWGDEVMVTPVFKENSVCLEETFFPAGIWYNWVDNVTVNVPSLTGRFVPFLAAPLCHSPVWLSGGRVIVERHSATSPDAPLTDDLRLVVALDLNGESSGEFLWDNDIEAVDQLPNKSDRIGRLRFSWLNGVFNVVSNLSIRRTGNEQEINFRMRLLCDEILVLGLGMSDGLSFALASESESRRDLMWEKRGLEWLAIKVGGADLVQGFVIYFS